jgi:hypothetical protein
MVTKLNDIDWSHTCCGGAGSYGEAKTKSGMILQVWNHSDTNEDVFMVRRFGADNRPIDAEKNTISKSDLEILLLN